jgi:DUF917 family protein
LSDAFLIQNRLKQGDASSPLLFISSLEFAIGKVLENQEELEMNGTHRLVVHADYINLYGGNINMVKRKTKAIIGQQGGWCRS